MELIQKVPMDEFMGRFGEAFFDRAMEYLEPEYTDDSPLAASMRQKLDALSLLRRPFPDQATAIQAAASHLFHYKNKMVFMNAEMGTGKTLMGSLIPLLSPRPLRVLVVCPPHLVHKWAREIEKTVANAKVHKINHAGANSALMKAFKANPGRPQQPEYWIIGRVRMRMGYVQQPAIQKRSLGLGDVLQKPRHVCPNCGGEVLRPVTAKREIEEKTAHLLQREDADVESGEPIYFEYPESAYFTAGRRRCEWIVTRGRRPHITRGCGDALWQAARAHHRSPADTLMAAFKALPGVGDKKARAIAGLADLPSVINGLDNGEILPSLAKVLGPAMTQRVERYMQTVGFTIGTGDYAPAEFIKKRLPKDWFQLVEFDELHELKGDNTAQGVAYGILAGRIRHVVGLTGTLVDGYAQSLHPLLFRADPKRMMELGYHHDDGARFQREMGVVKEVVTTEESDGLKTARGRRKVKRQTRNLPGLHPRVITELLLPNTIFVNLTDIERGLQELGRQKGMADIRLLPSYRETSVKLPMTTRMKAEFEQFAQMLLDRMKQHLRSGDKSLVGPVISTLLYAADGMFQAVACESRHYGCLGSAAPAVDPQELLPKEQFMLDLARRELANGRKLLVYTSYSGKRDLTRRYANIFNQAGIKAKVLDSRVPTDYREIWVEDALAAGTEVIVCNPELVKTGLDLLPFVTILFMQTGSRVDTLLQAARRSWRIGQEEPVRVYFAGYDGSPQMTLMALMAQKVAVAQQAKGDISANGLMATITDEEDSSISMMAIANAILDERRDKTHDTLTGAIASLDEDELVGEFCASSMSVLQALLEPATPSAAPTPTPTAVAVDCTQFTPSAPAPIRKPQPVAAATPTPTPNPVDELDSILADVFAAVAAGPRSRPRRQEMPHTSTTEAPSGAQFRLF